MRDWRDMTRDAFDTSAATVQTALLPAPDPAGTGDLFTDACVGFADCPCSGCSATRVAAAAAHPDHQHVSDRSYCGACRTAERDRYRVRA